MIYVNDFCASIYPNISQYIPATSPKYLRKISQGSDFLGILLHLRGTFCLSAAYNEALVLMDDPFAGFSNEEVDELFEAGAPDVGRNYPISKTPRKKTIGNPFIDIYSPFFPNMFFSQLGILIVDG